MAQMFPDDPTFCACGYPPIISGQSDVTTFEKMQEKEELASPPGRMSRLEIVQNVPEFVSLSRQIL